MSEVHQPRHIMSKRNPLTFYGTTTVGILVIVCLPSLITAQQRMLITTPQEDIVLKDNNVLYACKGEHPRCEVPVGIYGYPQFGGHPLKDFVAISDVLPPGAPLEHYQSFIAEIISQRPRSNAVAIWGDATAAVDDAVVWGGFLTARTGLFQQKLPRDAELIGLEVNVLNAMLPGIFPNKSKVGVRVVGFGNTSTAAFQVFPDQPGTSSGRFENILAVHADTLTPNGTVFGVAPQRTKIGLNFEGSTFTDSAVLLSPKSPITFRVRDKADARIYRDEFEEGHLVLQAGPSGLRITDSLDNRTLFYVHPDGSIDHASTMWQRYFPWIAAAGSVLALLLLAVAYLYVEVFRLRRLVAISHVEPINQKVGPFVPSYNSL
jgi:hypothetical protein